MPLLATVALLATGTLRPSLSFTVSWGRGFLSLRARALLPRVVAFRGRLSLPGCLPLRARLLSGGRLLSSGRLLSGGRLRFTARGSAFRTASCPVAGTRTA